MLPPFPAPGEVVVRLDDLENLRRALRGFWRAFDGTHRDLREARLFGLPENFERAYHKLFEASLPLRKAKIRPLRPGRPRKGGGRRVSSR